MSPATSATARQTEFAGCTVGITASGAFDFRELSHKAMIWLGDSMKKTSRYHGHRFPTEIISAAVWSYHRFSLSFRDIDDLMTQRGVTVSYESIRRWCLKFRPGYQRASKRREAKSADRWHVDEAFLKINGEILYLWRAVDQGLKRE